MERDDGVGFEVVEVTLLDLQAGAALGSGEVEKHDDGGVAVDGAGGHDFMRDRVRAVELFEFGVGVGVGLEDVLREVVDIGVAHDW